MCLHTIHAERPLIACFQVELECERLSWELVVRDVREYLPGIYEYGVTTGWILKGHAVFSQQTPEVGNLSDAVVQIVVFHSFVKSDSQGVQIPACPPTCSHTSGWA